MFDPILKLIHKVDKQSDSFKIKIEEFDIGVCKSNEFVITKDHFGIESYARINGIDIVVYGGTHKLHVEDKKQSELLIINPGTATGAFSVEQPYSLVLIFVILILETTELHLMYSLIFKKTLQLFILMN